MKINIERTKFFLHSLIFLSMMSCCFVVSCKKLIEIDPPHSTITTFETFADSLDANSAIAGIYSNMINTHGSILFGNGLITAFCGLSADELVNFNPYYEITQFYNNSLLPDNATLNGNFWNQPYSLIYQANACIEGLQASAGVSQIAKNQLLGEAEFLRAFIYFYLVNIYGDVPYITSTAWTQTATTLRTPKAQVYESMINDLKEAQNLLRSDYSYSSGEKIRANKWAATALLARIYLYMGDWVNAEAQATAVINSTDNFSLSSDLNNIFLANSAEAILQWQLNTNFPSFNATAEGYTFIPDGPTSNPSFYLSSQLLNAFENGDQRKIAWLDSTTYDGTVYYFPFKYKIGPEELAPASDPVEYYMVLRLAEQYLIRAEARAQQNNTGDAESDLNTIRNRAGLSNTSSADQSALLGAIAQERRIEFFAEWGHRWLDLKRTAQADAVLSQIKNGWTANAQLYPIPHIEIQNDPNLKQNPGY